MGDGLDFMVALVADRVEQLAAGDGLDAHGVDGDVELDQHQAARGEDKEQLAEPVVEERWKIVGFDVDLRPDFPKPCYHETMRAGFQI